MLFNPLPRQKPFSSIHDFFIFIRMLLKGDVIEGPCIKNFERCFAEEYAMKHVLTMGSCRSGFSLIIDALNIKSGDEVILPAFNLNAFAKILMFKNVKPVFIDADKETFNMDASQIEAKITSKTRAIVVVHLFGNVCDMDRIINIAKKHNLYIIEDCANAYQAEYKHKRVGLFGDVACFSLGHSKDLSVFAGGIISTNNDNLYDQLDRLYKNTYIFPKKSAIFKMWIKNVFLKIATLKVIFLIFVYPAVFLFRLFDFDIVGRFIEDDEKPIKYIASSRLTNFQACVGIKKLKEKNNIQRKRIEIAKVFNQELGAVEKINVPKILEGGTHVYWNYPILCDNRSKMLRHLIWHGIDARAVDNYDCNTQGIFGQFKTNCPNSKSLSETMLTLPIYHYMNLNDAIGITKVVKNFHK